MKKELSLLGQFWRGDFRHYRFITTVAFLFLVLAGFLGGLWITDLAENVMDYFQSIMEQAGVMDEDGAVHAVSLFFNNFRAMLLGIAYGLIPFLFLPALNLGFNALIVGVCGAIYADNGYGVVLYLAGILPHGIFEIPGLIFSIACGIYLCRSITDYARNNVKGTVKAAVFNCLRVFIIVITPLLILAALVEAYVTPRIMQLLM